MWRVFKTIGCYGSYDYDETIAPKDTSLIPLDKVECARGAKLKELRQKTESKPRYAFSAKAFLFLSSLAFVQSLLIDPLAPLPQTHVAEKWATHIETLRGFTLIEKCEYQELLSSSSYFAVLKSTDPPLCRSIFNGKLLSKAMKPAWPVHLPFLPNLLSRLSRFVAEGGGATVVVGDIRHWFHQLEADQNVSNFFGIRLPGFIGRWRGLPMGISYAPYVAQNIAWMLLLYREENEEELFVFPNSMSASPEFVNVKGGGIMTLYYDNFIALGLDHAIMEKVYNRIKDPQLPSYSCSAPLP